MRTVGVIGTSGFAREVADVIVELGASVIHVALDAEAAESLVGGGEVILEAELPSHPGLPLALGIGDCRTRSAVWSRFADRVFPNVIHPSVSSGRGSLDVLTPDSALIICAGVRLTNNIKLGRGVVLNLNVTVGHDCLIDDFSSVAPGANISGNVHIEERCWIGTGSAINQGDEHAKLVIGRETVIGSGAVVLTSCERDSVYAGVPAKRIR